MAIGQVIHSASTRDGARLAYTENGSGPALVIVGHWPSHVVMNWKSPVWHHWLEGLSRSRRVIRCDSRGTGLSAGGRSAASLDTWVEDLETVVAAVGVVSFAVLGMLNGGRLPLNTQCGTRIRSTLSSFMGRSPSDGRGGETPAARGRVKRCAPSCSCHGMRRTRRSSNCGARASFLVRPWNN